MDPFEFMKQVDRERDDAQKIQRQADHDLMKQASHDMAESAVRFRNAYKAQANSTRPEEIDAVVVAFINGMWAVVIAGIGK